MVRDLPVGARSLGISVCHVNDDGDSNAALSVRFLDESGHQILPASDLPQNPKLGPCLFLVGKKGEHSVSEVQIECPSGATKIQFIGHDWGQKTPDLIGPIEISAANEDEAKAEEFLSRLPESVPLIVLDTTAPPLGHATLSLRPNNLAQAYAARGAWVVFLPFGSLQGFPKDVSASIFQSPRSDFEPTLAELEKIENTDRCVYVCSSFPSLQSVTTAARLKSRGWTVCYEVRDDMEEFNRVGYSKWYSPALERQMLRVADSVVSVSDALDAKLLAMLPGEMPRHTVIPNAVNRRVIDSGEPLRSAESADFRASSTIVGYVGHLTPAWFDWAAVSLAALSLPELTFEIVGHGAPDNPSLPTNVKLLGPKSHDELPEIVSRWKVGLIPFTDQPLTHSVDPNKIYEYFAWGLRCVTAPMGKVGSYPSTWVYNDPTEFVSCLVEATASKMGEAERLEMNAFIENCDWDNRAAAMLEEFKRAGLKGLS